MTPGVERTNCNARWASESKPGKASVEDGRHPARQPTLQQGGARTDGDTGGVGDGERAAGGTVGQALILHGKGLGHRKIIRQLNHAKMVILAADVGRGLNHIDQRQIRAIARRDAKPIPGRGAVPADAAVGDFTLEQFEGGADARVEIVAADGGQLALGIVQVVDIDGFEAEVGAAEIDHRFEPSRRHAMRPLDQIIRRDDTGFDVGIFEPFARIGRHLAIEGDVAALGRDDDFLTPDLVRGDQFRDHLADGTLAPLEAIVDGSIDQVDAAEQRGAQGASS